MAETRIERWPGFRIVGVSLRTTNQRELETPRLEELWAQFRRKKLLTIPHPAEPGTIYSAYVDYESDFRGPYTAIVGTRVTQVEAVPAGMMAKDINAGRYAVFEAADPSEIVATWVRIWRTDLNRAYLTDFERHRPGNIEIFVGLRD